MAQIEECFMALYFESRSVWKNVILAQILRAQTIRRGHKFENQILERSFISF